MLLVAIRNGRHDAFARVFREYYADMVIFAYTIIPDRTLCEDIAQSVFLRLWENRHTLNIHTSIKSYLIGAVRNFCIDEMRRRKIRLQYITSEVDDEIWAADPSDYLLFSELCSRYSRAMKLLPADEREVIILRREQGLKLAVMADKLKVSVRTIENRLNRAMAHLKAMLEE